MPPEAVSHQITNSPTHSLFFSPHRPHRHLPRVPDPGAELAFAQGRGDVDYVALLEQRRDLAEVEPAEDEEERRQDRRDHAPLADRVDDEQLEVGQPEREQETEPREENENLREPPRVRVAGRERDYP